MQYRFYKILRKGVLNILLKKRDIILDFKDGQI
jgi:hypothetical protein